MNNVQSELSTTTWERVDDRLKHDDGCWFRELSICTCGLIHHFKGHPDRWPDWWAEQWGRQERLLGRLRDFVAVIRR